MKFVVGLTGQTGAGKSSLCSAAQDNGFLVIDCDSVAHEVQQRKNAKDALCKAFGADIIDTDGTLNRKSLAAKAFKSREQTELLNRTLLPFIVDEINYIIKNAGQEHILLDAPTLFESGADKMCKVTIGVIAKQQIRLNRIIERDNLTVSQARQRLAAGKPDEFYKQKCDYILTNNSSTNEFINNFNVLIKDILGGR